MYPFILLLLLFYTIVFIWCCHFDPNRLLYLLCTLINTRNWSNDATVIQWKKWVIIFTGTTLVPFPCYFPFLSIHKQKWTTPNSFNTKHQTLVPFGAGMGGGWVCSDFYHQFAHQHQGTMKHGCSNHSNLKVEAECLSKTLSYLNLNMSRTKNGWNQL